MAKYMQGICATCKEFDDRETTLSLRSYMQEQLDTTNKAIIDGRETDLSEKDQIKQTISDHKKIAEKFR